MTDIEDRLRDQMRLVDETTVMVPGLEDRVHAGVRRKRVQRRLGGVAAAASMVLAGVVFAATAETDDRGTALDPATTGPEAALSCEGLRIRATGVATVAGADGSRELSLVLDNGRSTLPCQLEGRVRVSMTAGREEAVASKEVPATVIGDGDSVLLDVDWSNWCAAQPGVVKVVNGDEVAQSVLPAVSATPRCVSDGDDPTLSIIDVNPTSVASASTMSPNDSP